MGVTSYPLKGCARLNEFSHFGSLFENRLDFILVSFCLLALFVLPLFLVALPPFCPQFFPLPILYFSFPFRFSSSITCLCFVSLLTTLVLSSFLISLLYSSLHPSSSIPLFSMYVLVTGLPFHPPLISSFLSLFQSSSFPLLSFLCSSFSLKIFF